MSPTLKLLQEAERAAALTAETLDTAANGAPQHAHVLRAHAAQARLFVYAVRGLRLTLTDPVGSILTRPELETVPDERETAAGHALVWEMNALGWRVSTPSVGHAAGYTAHRTADGALVYARTLADLVALVRSQPAPGSGAPLSGIAVGPLGTCDNEMPTHGAPHLRRSTCQHWREDSTALPQRNPTDGREVHRG